MQCSKGLGLLASPGVRCTIQVLESLLLQSSMFSESWRSGRVCHGVPQCLTCRSFLSEEKDPFPSECNLWHWKSMVFIPICFLTLLALETR